MDPSFIPIETVPSKTPFGLDQLRRSYKTALDAASAIAAAPNVGDPDETFAFMFLMPISTPESAESATRIDLIYQGCLRDDGGSPPMPILPDQKHEASNAIMSASSIRPRTGPALTSPITIQYYSPTSSLSYISYGAAGTTDADDPAAGPSLITLFWGDSTFVPSAGYGDIVSNFFTLLGTRSQKSTEIVPGQFWSNVSTKTKTLSPWLFNFPSGAHAFLASESAGYAVGDIITINEPSPGTHTATVVVDAPIYSNGYILNFHQTANTFTSEYFLLPGSAPTHGPPRHTALWNIVVIP